MTRLPAELIANIISCLAGEGNRYDGSDRFFVVNKDWKSDCLALAPFAAVSRGWQQRIEAVTFAHIALTPARLASPLAAQALTPDRVRSFVRTIRFDVVLPPYDEQARAQREDEADRATNNGVFTNATRRLFALLADRQGGGQQQQQPKICLSITTGCISDAEDMETRLYQWRVSGRLDADIYEARYKSSYIDLRLAAGTQSIQDEAEALPQLRCINQFRVFITASCGRLYSTWRPFAPRAICLIASRMPGLERIQWVLSDNEKRDVALRKSLRADFANALQTLPSSLQHFELEYHRAVPLDHSFQTPSLDETDRHNDKLSLALYKLSQRLTTFTLMADVGPEVLWPFEHTQDKDSLWPRMQRYFINPGAIAPSGQWRFLPSDSNDSDDEQDMLSNDIDPFAAPGDEIEEHFRNNPDPKAVHALLLATARAVRRMPVLRDMRFVLERIGDGQLEVEYMVKAGTTRVGTAELVVESHPLPFRPDEEVLQIWREAAEEHVGAGSGLVVVVRDPWAW